MLDARGPRWPTARRSSTPTGRATATSRAPCAGGNDCGYADIVKGDVEQGFAEADVVVESRYVADMSHPAPIEPHAVVAQWQGDRVTIWSTSQVPYAARSGVAETLEVPESNVRVIVPHLGGGFGGKCEFHFEAHVAALARAARRPVRLVLDRREEFLAPDMIRHAIVTEVKTGVRHDGTIVAREARLAARHRRLRRPRPRAARTSRR